MMQSPWTKELLAICQATRFETPDVCEFAGRRLVIEEAPDGAPASPRPDREHASLRCDARVELFSPLSHAIYVNCFARQFTGVLPTPSPVYDRDFVPDPQFPVELAASNQSRPGWSPGWEVCQIGAERDIQVRNGDRYRTVPAGHYAFTAGPGMTPQVGDHVNLQVLDESFCLQPGMYFAFGETLGDQFDETDCLRFYFHLKPLGAPQLLKQLTLALNRFQIAFEFKCQKYRENFDRVDACVLYVARRYADIVYQLVIQCAGDIHHYFKPSVPLFTKRIHEGIGVADDPGGGRSFGQDRCDLIAAAILNVQAKQPCEPIDPKAFMKVLESQFDWRGLSWERPYLNPGRVEMFDAFYAGETGT